MKASKKRQSVGIIGGGFGGLAAAALLAKDGFAVTVFEKNEQLGGRASVLKKHGFTFDMGPSWYLMPDVIERFFAQFDCKPADFLNYAHSILSIAFFLLMVLKWISLWVWSK